MKNKSSSSSNVDSKLLNRKKRKTGPDPGTMKVKQPEEENTRTESNGSRVILNVPAGKRRGKEPCSSLLNSLAFEKKITRMSRRCSTAVDEEIGDKVEDINISEKDNLRPQHERQKRKSKSNASVAKVIGVCSLVRDVHKDDEVDGAALTQKLKVGGLEHTPLTNKVMLRCSTRKKQNRIPYLSTEIIFNILIRIPAEIIYDVMRYVCREWYDVIHDRNFINKHLLQSTEVLLVQSRQYSEFAHSLEITREGGVKMTKIGFRFRGRVWASYDGLVLCSDRDDEYILHIANPVTKQHMTLPPVLFSNFGTLLCSCAIAYVSSTGHYKVVQAYQDKKGLFHCAILTLGIDNAWRHFDMEFVVTHPPVSVGGFIYWTVIKNYYVLGLDVETERFHHVPIPEGYEQKHWMFLKMGRYLSFVTKLCNGLSFEVWVLSKTRDWEWTRMTDIDIGSQRHVYERILIPREYDGCDLVEWWRRKFITIYPLAWLKDGELLIFRVQGPPKLNILHNMKTGKVHPFIMDESISNRFDCPHIHSLVLFPSNLG